jgi:hypothetical protein
MARLVWRAIRKRLCFKIGESEMTTIVSMLDLSTGHVTEATAKRLTDRPESIGLPVYPKGEYGWIVWAGTESVTRVVDVPADLVTVVKFAQERGCEWIMFDCDAPLSDSLPSFDW